MDYITQVTRTIKALGEKVKREDGACAESIITLTQCDAESGAEEIGRLTTILRGEGWTRSDAPYADDPDMGEPFRRTDFECAEIRLWYSPKFGGAVLTSIRVLHPDEGSGKRSYAGEKDFDQDCDW